MNRIVVPTDRYKSYTESKWGNHEINQFVASEGKEGVMLYGQRDGDRYGLSMMVATEAMDMLALKWVAERKLSMSKEELYFIARSQYGTVTEGPFMSHAERQSSLDKYLREYPLTSWDTLIFQDAEGGRINTYVMDVP